MNTYTRAKINDIKCGITKEEAQKQLKVAIVIGVAIVYLGVSLWVINEMLAVRDLLLFIS